MEDTTEEEMKVHIVSWQRVGWRQRKDSRKNNAPETKASAGAYDKSGTGVGGTVARRVFSSSNVCVVFLSHNLSQSPPQKCSKGVLH